MARLPRWLALTLSVCLLTSAMIHKLQMPEGLQVHFEGAKMKHNASDVPGEQIFWECMQKVMWQMAEQMGHNVTRKTRDYVDRLLQVAVDTDPQIPRHRKEYRMLTDDERERFHRAILALKEDNSLEPNVYTAIAEIHVGHTIHAAHFGASFLGWHRLYTLIFETALRMKDPLISVPYWASNLDNEMEDPTQSVIWSDKFLGNGDGFVTSGPFANFRVFSTDSKLTRNIGASGSLMTNKGIHGVLLQNHTHQISNPNAPPAHNLELQHNTIHVWIGGNMDDLSTSAEDPVFFLHHSFVDYLWEEFRTAQKKIGIDPDMDYPTSDWGADAHAPTAKLNFSDLRNMDALSSVFANIVKYDPSPWCTRSRPSCRSKYLRCDTARSTPICISMTRVEVNMGGDDMDSCEPHLSRAVQNNFAINQYCDIRKWAYIPVKIILQRPPEFSNYKAYPVINNDPVTDTDIFSTISVNKEVSKQLATYPTCKNTNSVARRIYIESYGLNYYGKYKDFSILDQRHALSTATTYLGIKSPDVNHSDVIVHAYDYCGRICTPYCLDAAVNPPKFTPCSGVIRVTPEEPKFYGRNYAEALNSIWRADGPDDLPEVIHPHAFITFYCDYSGTWPWNRDIQTARNTTITETAVKKQHTKKIVKQTKTVKRKRKRKTKARAIVKRKPPKRTCIHNRNSVQMKTPNLVTKKSVQLPNFNKQLPNNKKPKTTFIDLRGVTSRPPVPPRQRQFWNKGGARAGISNNVNSNRRQFVQRRPLFIQRSFVNPNPRGRSTNPRFGFQTNCRLRPGCVLPVPCTPCEPGTRRVCNGPRPAHVICIDMIFMLENSSFNFWG